MVLTQSILFACLWFFLLTLYVFCDIVLSQSMLFVSFCVLAILILCCVLMDVACIMQFVWFRFEFDDWGFLFLVSVCIYFEGIPPDVMFLMKRKVHSSFDLWTV